MNQCENHDLRIDNIIDNEQRIFESDVDRIMRSVWFIGILNSRYSLEYNCIFSTMHMSLFITCIINKCYINMS